MISSVFEHAFKTEPDNTPFWRLIDHLKARGYHVKYEMKSASPGNTINLLCYPYPKPVDMEMIKELIYKQSKSKGK